MRAAPAGRDRFPKLDRYSSLFTASAARSNVDSRIIIRGQRSLAHVYRTISRFCLSFRRRFPINARERVMPAPRR